MLTTLLFQILLCCLPTTDCPCHFSEMLPRAQPIPHASLLKRGHSQNPPPATCHLDSTPSTDFAWQPMYPPTSRVTGDAHTLFNQKLATEIPGHDSACRTMLTTLLFRRCRAPTTFHLTSQVLLLLSGDIELNPGQPQPDLPSIMIAIEKLEKALLTFSTDINEIKATQINHEQLLTTLSNQISALESPQTEQRTLTETNEALSIKPDIEILKAAHADANNRMHRNNVLFFGLDNSADETWKGSEKAIISFCDHHLNIKLEPNSIERAHRLGTFADPKKRPVVIKLSHFKTKEKIISNGPKLKGTTFAIREDFTPATRLARSKLLKFIPAPKLHIQT